MVGCKASVPPKIGSVGVSKFKPASCGSCRYPRVLWRITPLSAKMGVGEGLINMLKLQDIVSAGRGVFLNPTTSSKSIQIPQHSESIGDI